MTITKARKKFEELKTQILSDGKVDITETYVLLDFINEYVKSGNEKFVHFKKLLLQAATDKVITPEESKEIIDKINEISRFLKTEQLIEQIFFGMLVLLGIGYFAYVLF